MVANLSKGLAVFSTHKRALSSFKKCSENFDWLSESFFENLLILFLLENNRSSVFQASIYVAISVK